MRDGRGGPEWPEQPPTALSLPSLAWHPRSRQLSSFNQPFEFIPRPILPRMSRPSRAAAATAAVALKRQFEAESSESDAHDPACDLAAKSDSDDDEDRMPAVVSKKRGRAAGADEAEAEAETDPSIKSSPWAKRMVKAGLSNSDARQEAAMRSVAAAQQARSRDDDVNERRSGGRGGRGGRRGRRSGSCSGSGFRGQSAHLARRVALGRERVLRL